jgi:hypothetical protein
MILKQCGYCGKTFNAESPRRKNCSRACADESRRLRRPPMADLVRLYDTQRLTTRQIGCAYGVSKASVVRWLKRYGILLRPATGLANKGIDAPSATHLRTLVHVQHLSYAEIADRYGCDASAVRHWLIKHDIPRPKVWETRKKRQTAEPTADDLRRLYVNLQMSTTGIGELYGLSASAVGVRLKRHDIPLRPPGWRNLITMEDGHTVRSTYEQKVCAWLHQHGITHHYEPRLPFDPHLRADFLALNTYIEIWGVTNIQAYTERKLRKRALYREHGLALIEIPASAFFRRDEWKRRLLRLQQATLPF